MNSVNKTTNAELTIGISGHRWVRESQRLKDAINHVLEEIARVYSFNKLKLLSPLAEGSDCIVAKQILSSSNAHLVALLPFPVEDYVEDFSTPEFVRAFRDLYRQADQVIELPGNQAREDAYVTLGRALLDACDILIGIWDGEPARGRGGTAEIVQSARARGMPLAWILLEQPDTVGSDVIPPEAKIEITFEHFPSHKWISEPEN
jgi:hypothetical protein